MRGLARQENISLSFAGASPGLSVQLVVPPAENLDSELASGELEAE